MNKIKEIDSNLFEQLDKNYLCDRTLATINQKNNNILKTAKSLENAVWNLIKRSEKIRFRFSYILERESS